MIQSLSIPPKGLRSHPNWTGFCEAKAFGGMEETRGPLTLAKRGIVVDDGDNLLREADRTSPVRVAHTWSVA
eukprot:1071352-Prorocentrum_lima.AAC.1